MSGTVKRVYSSELRAAQARATRRVIVTRQLKLFVDGKARAETVDAIAEEARGEPQDRFRRRRRQGRVLKLALDWALAGDDEPIAVSDRPEVAGSSRNETRMPSSAATPTWSPRSAHGLLAWALTSPRASTPKPGNCGDVAIPAALRRPISRRSAGRSGRTSAWV